MTKKCKAAIVKMIAGVCVLFFLGTSAFSLVIVNESDNGFQELDSPAIRSHIIAAAGHFLESQSAVLMLSNKIELAELQGSDYDELRQIIDSAIASMQNAENEYNSLSQAADSAAYDQDMSAALQTFDYAAFQESRSLNGVIFARVESLLGSGDIRGVYQALLSDTQEILVVLARIKSLLDIDLFPDISDIWQANQAYSQTLLFGQYTAQIFHDIIGK